MALIFALTLLTTFVVLMAVMASSINQNSSETLLQFSYAYSPSRYWVFSLSMDLLQFFVFL